MTLEWQELVNRLPQAACLCDRDGNVLHANAAARVLLPEDATGNRQRLTLLLSCDEQRDALHGMLQAVSPGSSALYPPVQIHAVPDIGMLLLGLEDGQILALLQAIGEAGQQARKTDPYFPNIGFWLVDGDGSVLLANEEYARLSGYSRSQLQNMQISELELHDSVEEIRTRIQRVSEQGFVRFRSFHRHRDGTEIPVEITAIPQPDRYNGCCLVFIEDIRKQLEQEREATLATAVMETMDQAVVVTDANNHIIYVNPVLSEITGYVPIEVIGKNPRIFASGRHDRDFYSQMWQALKEDDYWEGEIWDRKKNGEIYAKWQTISVVRGRDGNVLQHISVFSDITERKLSEKLVWQRANFCPVTSLPNRYMFIERLEHEIGHASAENRGFALIYLDLDHFREINETLGQGMGDLLLGQVAGRLKESVRKTDTVARLAGDEFVIMLPGMVVGQLLDGILQTLLAAFVSPFYLNTEEIHISASMGVVFFPDDAASSEDLLTRAEQGMYAAKEKGRSGYAYYTPDLQAQVINRRQRLRTLREAITKKQFVVYYQPIVSLPDLKIHKAEALVRWQHPEQGLIMPGEFIPLAEETGLIGQIGNQVFSQAMAQAGVWRKALEPEFQISINKSPLQFMEEKSSYGGWYEVLTGKQPCGHGLVVEITETALMEHDQDIEEKLLAFRDLGVEVALDDFGTGYSSLAYLKHFDIDYIKIDQVFVRHMIPGSDDLALCKAIIEMAHQLGIKVIAEGVETREQLELLSAAGCDFAQGYYFSRPVPAAEFERLLRAQYAG